MKHLMKTLMVVLLGTALIASPLYAGPGDKTVEKARAAVNNAAPDDWETLAKSAHMCIRKKVNLPEAKEWLDKSLEIKKSVYGLEVKGDYYMHSKLYDKAIDNYVESMLLLKEKDFAASTDHLQAKIEEAKKLSES